MSTKAAVLGLLAIPAAYIVATGVTTWWYNARYLPRIAGED